MTGSCISGEELWLLENVDKNRYQCPGCQIPVNPVSFAPDLKRRPHFKLFPGIRHLEGCPFEDTGKDSSSSGKTPSRSTGLPVSYPSKLVLEPRNHRLSTRKAITEDDDAIEGNRLSPETKSRGYRHSYTVSTIRSLARHFLLKPEGRYFSLIVPGVVGRTYSEIFEKIKPQALYGGQRLFYGNLKFNGVSRTESSISVTLSQGLWNNGIPRQLPVVRIDTSSWSGRQKNYVYQEVTLAMEEAKGAYRQRADGKAWFFFVGRHLPGDAFRFECRYHRLTCSLFGEHR